MPDLNRREFVSTLGAGLLFQAPPRVTRLHLGADGSITVFSGKVEMGQGVRTELAMAAAEELRVKVESVHIVLGDTALCPDDGLTAGSRTTPQTVPAVRRACAAARELLMEAAKKQWQPAPNVILQIKDGVLHELGGTRTMSYAELASLELPTQGGVIPVERWAVLGVPHQRVNSADIVTGAHRYTSDLRRDNMLYACVLRPPEFGAKLESIDLEPARKLPGVTVVKDGDFIACAAPTSYAARRAAGALAATALWTRVTGQPDHTTIFDWLSQHAAAPARGGQNTGEVEPALASAAKRVKAVYHVPYIQHAPMEPRAAVAEWSGGQLTVWTSSQNPFGVRSQLMQLFQLPASAVRVIIPDSGGGFGGRHQGDAALEAARVAKAVGRPVKVRWTRREEFTWACFRPAGVLEAEAGLDASGRIVAWDFVNIGSGSAALDCPYRIPNLRTRYRPSRPVLREGSYRGLAATANNFARECFIDELAGAAGADPLEFRLAHLDGRLRDVLAAAAEKFNWRARAKDRTIGLACGTEKGSYTAACVEIAADRQRGVIEVKSICHAFECGAVLNPAGLRAQVEGCIIMGLGGALTESIEFGEGVVRNASFARYRVPRFRDVPALELVTLNRTDLPPAGAGETPIIPIAPAIANAVSRLTGRRVRQMPVPLKL